MQYTIESIIRSLPLKHRKALPFPNLVPCRAWYYKFLYRHPTISLKKAEYLSASRAQVTESRIRKWFEDIHELLEEEGVANVLNYPGWIFNCDETAVWLNPGGKRVLTKKGETAYSVSANDEKMNVTILFTASADGSMLPPMYVHKGERLPPNFKSRLPPTWKAKCTPKGWMTVEAFAFYIVHVFDAYLCKKGIQKPVILFVDGHVLHLSIEVTEYCALNGIVLVCLLAFTTHLVQPLDLSVFKAMKEAWKRMVGLFRFCNKRDPCAYEITPLMQELLEKFPLLSCIINGFRKAGLYPWDPSAVDYSKCRFSQETNPWLEDDDEVVPQNECADSNLCGKTFIQIFEDNMDASVLEQEIH